jgi:hypothetical protein
MSNELKTPREWVKEIYPKEFAWKLLQYSEKWPYGKHTTNVCKREYHIRHLFHPDKTPEGSSFWLEVDLSNVNLPISWITQAIKEYNEAHPQELTEEVLIPFDYERWKRGDYIRVVSPIIDSSVKGVEVPFIKEYALFFKPLDCHIYTGFTREGVFDVDAMSGANNLKLVVKQPIEREIVKNGRTYILKEN